MRTVRMTVEEKRLEESVERVANDGQRLVRLLNARTYAQATLVELLRKGQVNCLRGYLAKAQLKVLEEELAKYGDYERAIRIIYERNAQERERLQYIREHGHAPMGAPRTRDSEYYLVREYDKQREQEEEAFRRQ